MIFGQILTKPSVTSAPVLEPATQHGTQGRCSSAGPNNLQVLETGTSQDYASRVLRFPRKRARTTRQVGHPVGRPLNLSRVSRWIVGHFGGVTQGPPLGPEPHDG